MRAAAPCSTAPGHLAEEGLEDVAQPALEAEAAHAARAALGAEDPLRPVAVVAGPALWVAQDLVGDGDLLEARLGLGVALVGVGVQLSGPGPVGLLDLVVARVAGDPQQLVEVAQPVSWWPSCPPPLPPAPMRSPRRSPTTWAAASALE